MLIIYKITRLCIVIYFLIELYVNKKIPLRYYIMTNMTAKVI